MIELNAAFRILLVTFGVLFILIGGDFLDYGILRYIAGVVLIIIGTYAIILYGRVTYEI